MKQMIIRLMIAALAISLWVSCDQEKTIMYQQEAGVRFMYQAEDEYSFVDNYGETVHLYYITVATTGDSVDYERKVSIAVVENDTNYVNTARPEQYKLLEGVVPAGSFSGEVPVEIHCTPDMSDSSFVVNIKLVPNEDFPLAGFDNRYFEILALLLGVVGLEGQAVGMRDSAQVLVKLVLGHADAVVRHGDGASVLVERHADSQVVLAHFHVLVGQAAEVQLVHRVRRVGNELAQEDLAVGVDGVDHQVQQFLALGLELPHGGQPFLSHATGGAFALRDGATARHRGQGEATLAAPPSSSAAAERRSVRPAGLAVNAFEC